MKEGLRSSSLRKGEKIILDLNKEPYEHKSSISHSASSTECNSADGNFGNSRIGLDPSECEKNADLCVTCNADANDLHSSQREREGRNVECPNISDDANAEGCVGRNGSPLVLTNSVPLKEGMIESQPSGCSSNAAAAVGVDVIARADTCTKGVVAGKGRRGRKRKMIDGAREKNSENEPMPLSSQEKRIEEKSCGLEGHKLVETKDDWAVFVESCKDADMGVDLATGNSGDAGGTTIQNRKELSNGSRGRKRKMTESSGGNKDNGVISKKAENLSLDGRPEVVGRVLRSRTMATTDGEKQAYVEDNVGFAGKKVTNEIDLSEKKNKRMEVDEGAQLIRTGKKKLKRRGRPPKIQGKNGMSKVIGKKKVKLNPQKNIKRPKAQDFVNGSDFLKSQRKTRASDLVDNDKIQKSKKNGNQLKSKSHKSIEDGFQNGLTNEQCLSGKSIIRKALKNSKCKKEGKLGAKEEQQLVREQIISILKKAGWTIEFRQRMSREYLDAVYVDCEGKTYWSVTLAYKTLRKQVEAGTADAKAISAFTPIPEDKLSSLFRVRKEKKDKHQKQQKEAKKSATKKKLRLKGKESLDSSTNPGDIREKTEIDNCGQGNSMAFLSRGKPRSSGRAEIRKPCALLARGSENGLDPDGDGFELYDGKRSLLSWMIDLGTVPPDGKVQYMTRRRKSVLLEGKISREGICCGCCNGILTLPDFESHAGSNLGQPFNNIYLESGHSLSQCLTDSWSKQEETDHIGFNLVDVQDDPNDDTCNICGDGGDLICCDGCPSTFHQSCLQIQKFPSGDWHCLYCSCKYCGTVTKQPYQSDDIHDMDDSELLACFLCEEKFHKTCIPGENALRVNPKGLLFCARGCEKLFKHLQTLLGVRHQLEEGFSWTIIRRQDIKRDTSRGIDSSQLECNSKLAVAFSIMDECFLPIIDPRSNTNMVQSVIYSCGSNFRRLNYSGFYTFILERGDELLSAAAIRIHGNQLAEMPFIGTRYMYRRQGMCRRLLTAVEMALSSLDVEKLVIPAISELNETWTKVFKFLPLEESKRQEMKYMSMIVFPGTNMLQKPLIKHQCTKGQTKSDSGTEFSQILIEHAKDGTTPGPDSDASSEIFFHTNDESAIANGSGTDMPDGPSNDGPESTNQVGNPIMSSIDGACPDLGAFHDKLENSNISANDSPAINMQQFPETVTSANANSATTNVFPDTETSKCNYKLNQLSDRSAEGQPLTRSQIGPLGMNHAGKMFHVPEEAKEALKHQHESKPKIFKHICGSPNDRSDIESANILSYRGGLQREVNTSDNPGDELFSVTSPIGLTCEASNDVNHEMEPNNVDGVSLSVGPQLSLKPATRDDDSFFVNPSGNTLCTGQSLSSSSSHPDVTRCSVPSDSISCGVPEVDRSRLLKSGKLC